ncbi:hypothetical protein KI387_040975, partial [Taxus chinensis]
KYAADAEARIGRKEEKFALTALGHLEQRYPNRPVRPKWEQTVRKWDKWDKKV